MKYMYVMRIFRELCEDLRLDLLQIWKDVSHRTPK